MNVQAATIKVGPGRTYSSLHAALLKAKDHDTILIYGGKVYHEQLVITKPLTLKGIGKPVIDGDRKGHVIEINSSGVIIENLKIVNSGRSSAKDLCGIYAHGVNKLRIIGNTLRQNQFSIMLHNCQYSEISHNNISSDISYNPIMGNAVHCWKCTSLLIHNNVIGHNRDGIYLEFVDNSNIFKNTVSGCERYGLHFMFSHHNVYDGNRFSHNKAGVAVMYTHHVTMTDNVFENNTGPSHYGLLIKELQYSTLSGNRFRNNTVGLMIDGGADLKAFKNEFRGNGWGVKLVSGSSNDTIVQNNFFGNTFDMATNKSYNSNIIDGNYWDKYEGYDLDKNGKGDVPYHPLSLFSMLAEQNEGVLLFFRSFLMTLLDEAERMIPTITPDNYIDNIPNMRPYKI